MVTCTLEKSEEQGGTANMEGAEYGWLDEGWMTGPIEMYKIFFQVCYLPVGGFEGARNNSRLPHMSLKNTIN